MEDKNRELNAEELEQGAGGIGDREMDVEAMRHWVKIYKEQGRTKEDMKKSAGGEWYRDGVIDEAWDKECSATDPG